MIVAKWVAWTINVDQASDVQSFIFFHNFLQNTLQKASQFIKLQKENCPIIPATQRNVFEIDGFLIFGVILADFCNVALFEM